ncbi:hypothetical protein HR060_15455 [Catenovulum sp. SM1970]|uniref:hypothetical protein n=1 Tax=Marinifaba aquimaris TaxID=2741323 RepID=UPI001572E7F9|nr:hypothetical protein [Marinifaba aquimaris]NTS78247.1 hypothetical protein [Marinifaba aquimaris]
MEHFVLFIGGIALFSFFAYFYIGQSKPKQISRSSSKRSSHIYSAYSDHLAKPVMQSSLSEEQEFEFWSAVVKKQDLKVEKFNVLIDAHLETIDKQISAHDFLNALATCEQLDQTFDSYEIKVRIAKICLNISRPTRASELLYQAVEMMPISHPHYLETAILYLSTRLRCGHISKVDDFYQAHITSNPKLFSIKHEKLDALLKRKQIMRERVIALSQGYENGTMSFEQVIQVCVDEKLIECGFDILDKHQPQLCKQAFNKCYLALAFSIQDYELGFNAAKSLKKANRLDHNVFQTLIMHLCFSAQFQQATGLMKEYLAKFTQGIEASQFENRVIARFFQNNHINLNA